MINKTVYNLIPTYIRDQYLTGQTEGQFRAVTLFMDISGFTSMAQSFVSYDKEGTEELASVINGVFEPVIFAIYERGGFVTGFAGDALTVVFPTCDSKTALAACDTALSIRQIFSIGSRYEASFGQFELAVKQGVSAGNVEWAVMGPSGHKTYYFRGAGIEGCVQAEYLAQAGDIVLTKDIFALISENQVEYTFIDTNYSKLNSLKAYTKTSKIQISSVQLVERICYQFFPPELWQHSRQGEFRQAAIVFISFESDLNQTRLNALVTSTIELCDQFGGHFIEVDFGDKGGVMLACFGAPRTHENDVQRVLAFALALSNQLDKLEIKWRLGITYGQVYAGMVGVHLRSKYAVMGNVVNLSSRLMTQAQWGQILVSEAISQQQGFKFELKGKFGYKGFPNPLPTHELIHYEASTANVLEDADTQPTFVGRDAESKRLMDFARPIFSGKSPGSAVIYGDPGIGKSMLVAVLQRRLSEPLQWLVCTADQTLKQAFNPFINCLKEYFEQATDASETENKAKFLAKSQYLAAQLSAKGAPSTLQEELERTQSFIGALIDLHWTDSLYTQLDGKLRHANTLTAIKTWLFSESLIQPLGLILEDAHWLDQASHELLASLSQDMSAYPLMIVITSRYTDKGTPPEFKISLEQPKLILELKALPSESLRQQAEQIIKAPLSNSLFTLVNNRSQGNPFFAQQLLFYFQENNLLDIDENNDACITVDEIRLPSSINAILVARIDRLMQQAKEVVQTAAVIGIEFDVDILTQMLQTDIGQAVREAETNQIWQTVNNLKYIFKHVMLREAAYDMQLRQKLRQLHLLAALAYEKLHHRNLAPYFAILAYHYQLAMDTGQEQKYARLAGEHAFSKGNQKEAVAYFSQALELTVQEDQYQYELYLLREDAYHLIGDRENQSGDIVSLTRLAFQILENKTPKKLHMQVEVILRHARFRNAISDYSAGIIAAKRAYQLAKEANNTLQETDSQYWWSMALAEQGQYVKANEQLEMGLKKIGRRGDPNLRARLLKEQGWIAFRWGDSLLAMEKLGEALQIAQLKGNQTEEVMILKALGGAANGRGDYIAARTWQLQGLKVAQTIGHRQEEGSLYNNLGNTSRFLGELEMAIHYYQHAANLFRSTGWRLGEAISQVNLGVVLSYLGSFNRANEHAQKGLELAKSIHARMIEAVAFYVLGNIATANKLWLDAEQNHQRSIVLYQEMDLQHYVIEAKAGLIRAYLAQNKTEESRPLLADLVQFLNNGGSVKSVEEPIRVYLTGFQAMEAFDDSRAGQMLVQSYNLLNLQAARLPNKGAKRFFLEKIPFHHEVIHAWKKYKAPK